MTFARALTGVAKSSIMARECFYIPTSSRPHDSSHCTVSRELIAWVVFICTEFTNASKRQVIHMEPFALQDLLLERQC